MTKTDLIKYINEHGEYYDYITICYNNGYDYITRLYRSLYDLRDIERVYYVSFANATLLGERRCKIRSLLYNKKIIDKLIVSPDYIERDIGYGIQTEDKVFYGDNCIDKLIYYCDERRCKKNTLGNMENIMMIFPFGIVMVVVFSKRKA